jgi:hypothetical protein
VLTTGCAKDWIGVGASVGVGVGPMALGVKVRSGVLRAVRLLLLLLPLRTSAALTSAFERGLWADLGRKTGTNWAVAARLLVFVEGRWLLGITRSEKSMMCM